MKHWRNSIVASAAAAAVVVSAQAPRPNHIFILVDDLGFSDLGCYGGEIRTPNVDGLARGGRRFTQHYNSARCWPSRAALLTGYYPQQVRRNALPWAAQKGGATSPRPPWAALLPAMLKAAGYLSYHSGKWHIDGPVLAGGFDRSYRLEDADRYFSPRHHYMDDRPLPPVERGSNFYNTTFIADHAIDCLKKHAEHHADRPFFQYICFFAPHFPLHALPEDIARYAHRYTNGWNALQAERGRRLKEMGIVRHNPPPMETSLGPPYHFPDALERLGLGEVNRPLRTRWPTSSARFRR